MVSERYLYKYSVARKCCQINCSGPNASSEKDSLHVKRMCLQTNTRQNVGSYSLKSVKALGDHRKKIYNFIFGFLGFFQ